MTASTATEPRTCATCGRPHWRPEGEGNVCVACSAGESEATAQEPTLRFLTIAELRAQTPREPEWIWNGYLAAGSLALLAGKPKVQASRRSRSR